jgi:hypothetical protein
LRGCAGAKNIDQASRGRKPQRLLLRRSWQEDRLAHDDHWAAGRDLSARCCNTRGVRHAQIPAQRDDNLAVASAGTQIHPAHRGAFLLQQGRVWTQRLASI